MKPTHLHRLWRSVLFVHALLTCFPAHSQYQRNRLFQVEGFSLKTDLLTILGNTVEGGPDKYFFSAELYFNDSYSLNIDGGLEPERISGMKIERERIGTHFRWYFLQYDCNCSAFYAGPYFHILRYKQTVTDSLRYSSLLNYSSSFLEGGLIAGYEVILEEHFIVDLGIRTGMKFFQSGDKVEPPGRIKRNEGTEILVRVMLGVGYRF